MTSLPINSPNPVSPETIRRYVDDVGIVGPAHAAKLAIEAYNNGEQPLAQFFSKIATDYSFSKALASVDGQNTTISWNDLAQLAGGKDYIAKADVGTVSELTQDVLSNLVALSRLRPVAPSPSAGNPYNTGGQTSVDYWQTQTGNNTQVSQDLYAQAYNQAYGQAYGQAHSQAYNQASSDFYAQLSQGQGQGAYRYPQAFQNPMYRNSAYAQSSQGQGAYRYPQAFQNPMYGDAYAQSSQGQYNYASPFQDPYANMGMNMNMGMGAMNMGMDAMNMGMDGMMMNNGYNSYPPQAYVSPPPPVQPTPQPPTVYNNYNTYNNTYNNQTYNYNNQTYNNQTYNNQTYNKQRYTTPMFNQQQTNMNQYQYNNPSPMMANNYAGGGSSPQTYRYNGAYQAPMMANNYGGGYPQQAGTMSRYQAPQAPMMANTGASKQNRMANMMASRPPMYGSNRIFSM